MTSAPVGFFSTQEAERARFRISTMPTATAGGMLERKELQQKKIYRCFIIQAVDDATGEN